nr:PREDICTED: trichohyalin-like [Megachile rotundata]
MKVKEPPGWPKTREAGREEERGEMNRRAKVEEERGEEEKWEEEMISEEEERGKNMGKMNEEVKEGRKEVEREKSKLLKSLRKDWALEYLAEEEKAALEATKRECKDKESEEEKTANAMGDRMEVEERKKRVRKAEEEEEDQGGRGRKEKKREEREAGSDVIVEGTERTNEEEAAGEFLGDERQELVAMAMVAPMVTPRRRGEVSDEGGKNGHSDREREEVSCVETSEESAELFAEGEKDCSEECRNKAIRNKDEENVEEITRGGTINCAQHVESGDRENRKRRERTLVLYEEGYNRENYEVCCVLKVGNKNKTKRNNLIKIYRFVQGTGVHIVSVRMIGWNEAEITTKSKEEANNLLRKYSSREGQLSVFLPRRMQYRRGIIFEWEDSIKELEEEAMPGQGEFTLERLKRKGVSDGKIVYEPMRSIMITFRGSSLPTRLLIGQGHVGIRIEPFVEPVKQCFRCFRFGHMQTMCKERVKRCPVCGEAEHDKCERSPRCINCGGNHGSLARVCWMWQKEAAIRKIMAYRNVEFETARGIVSRNMGEIETDRVGGLDDIREEGSRDFPRLPRKERREVWDDKEVPIGRELENIRIGKEEVNRGKRGTRIYPTYSGAVSNGRRGDEEKEEAEKKRMEEEEGNDEAAGWTKQKRKYKGLKPSCFNEKTDLFLSNNRYICLDCKEKTEKQNREEREGIEILTRIPLPHDMVGEQPEGDFEYKKLRLALNKDEMEKERRRARKEKQLNREWLVELRKRTDDEIMEEMIKVLQEKKIEGKFHEIIRTRKYRTKRTVYPDPNEDWNEVTTPPFKMYIDERTREKLKRKAERERGG